MRPRRIALWFLAGMLAIALLPLAALLPRGGSVEAGGVLGGGWSWGDDGSKQLGNGAANDFSFVNAPVMVGPSGAQLTNLTAVSGGNSHSLALRTNGTVLAWGSDSLGQLGDGSANDGNSANLAVSVSNLTNIVAISAGGQHSLALRRDGTVWAWGNDGSRQLGNGVANDGDSSNVPVQVVGVGGSGLLTNVVAIAAGGSHSLALKSDGTVVAWGLDQFGQLGNGALYTGSFSNAPVAVDGLNGVTAIAAGGQHSIALKRDSTVVSWGYDNLGQLGNSTPHDGSFSDITVQVSGLTNVIAVAAGRDHSLALKSDGTVVAWGDDQFGQLGNGPTTDGQTSNVPVSVIGLSNVSAIAGGSSHSLARRADGTVMSWGRDQVGQLGNGAANDNSFSNIPTQTNTLANVVAIAAGGSHNLAIRSSTNMRGWGGNTYGQFGNGGSTPDDCDPGPDVIPCAKTALPILSLSSLVAVAAGDLHSVGVTSDGAVWSWGDDSTGQLGNGVGAPNSCSILTTPCALSPVPVTGLGNVVAVAVGDRHSVALRRDGTVWSWGSNALNQLGNGGGGLDDCDNGPGVLPCKINPVQVSGLTNIVAVAAGGSHSLALSDNGTVYAWGNGVSGQLGNGSSSSSNIPVPVSGLGPDSGVVAIAAGGNHSLALKADGTVISWGSDSNGQLGNGGANANSNISVPVTGLTNVIAIAAGGTHSLALRDDGTVAGWGSDSNGQLGNGVPRADSGTFATVTGLTNVIALAGGANHSLALKSDGTVAAWGLATPALLGNPGATLDDCDPGAGVIPCALAPVSVSNLTNIVAIAAGSAHNLAIAHPADRTSVDAAPATITYGTSSVQLSATVTNTDSSVPVGEGTVTFTVQNGATPLGSPITSGTVSGGSASATFPTTGIGAGTYSVYASYSGSTNFRNSSDNTPSILTINKANTSVTVAPVNIAFGTASVQLSATVNAANSALLTGGTLTFSVASGAVCSSAALAVPTGATSGIVNFTCNLPTSTVAGNYTINATYSGDANFNGSSNTNTLTIARATTTTTVVVTPGSAAYCGNSVTLSATITSSSGVAVNQGTVSFAITGPGSLGPVNNITVSAGAASSPLTLGTASAGSYTVTATYNPPGTGANFITSTSSGGGNGSLSITALNTTTTPDVTTRTYGQNIPLRAQVATTPAGGCNVNAGTVTFTIKQGATTVATVPSIAVSGTGEASGNYNPSTPLPVGSYTIEAVYGTTTNFITSTGTSNLTVQKANTTTITTNQSGAYGGSVQLTATIANSSSSALLTGGTLDFTVTGVCDPAPVSIPTTSFSATVQVSCALGTVVPGNYTITAAYSGDANFNASNNATATSTLTINKADTSTVVNAASATYGADSVNLTATLNNVPNAAAFTGGTVQFTVTQGATTVCTVTSAAITGVEPRTATASCPLTGAPRPGAGAYSIAAVYSGDTNFNGSTASPNATLTIGKATANVNGINVTAIYGEDAVVLSATVANNSNNVDLTGGTVTFTITGVCEGVVSTAAVGTDPVTVTANCPINGPPRKSGGIYNIAAVYSGDSNFNGHTDPSPATLTINATTSTTTVNNASGPYGGSVQLSATVQSGVALTGGSVTLGATGVCSAVVPITAGSTSANVQTTCNFGTVAPNTYPVTAVYGGNADVAGSSATPGTLTISQANSSITVSNVSVAYGNGTASLSATVANTSTGVNLTGGTVDFNIPGVCDPAPVAIPTTGSSVVANATCNSVGAAAGTYAIQASYSGNTHFAPSTATPGTLTITTTNTTTTVDETPPITAVYGSTDVQLIATVASSNGAALTGGTLTFAVSGGCNSGALAVTAGASPRTVTFNCPLGTLAGGSHTITATYDGDGNFDDSSDTGTLTVTKANTITETAGVSAVYGGGNVQLSATVRNDSNAAPLTGGTINFVVGPPGTPVCSPSVSVAAGANPRTVSATCALGSTTPGSYAIAVNYVGDGNFNNSASASGSNLTIAKANTSLQVTNVTATYAQGTLALNATVSNTSNGANMTVGSTVDFFITGVCDPAPVLVPTSSSNVQVNASCNAGTTIPGSYTISATYSGNDQFNSSVGSGNLSIGKRTPTVVVNDVTVGIDATQAILTATLSSDNPSVNLTGGTFTLSIGGICSSSALIVPSGVTSMPFEFTCNLNGAAPGSYAITGNYSGDTRFNAVSGTGMFRIDQPLVTLTVTANNGTVILNNSVSGSSSVSALELKQYMPGTFVTATPQAQDGYTFVGWTWDGVSIGWANPMNLTMDGNHTLVARFVQTATFLDVLSGQPYSTAVRELAARGLIRGYGNGNFGPNDTTQRSQMAALIARAMPTGPDSPPGGPLTPPDCIIAGSWDCENWGNDFFNPGGVDVNLWRNVGALAHYNVALGYGDGTFGPFDNVTYAQTISFITRAMIAKGYWVAQPNQEIPYFNAPAAHLGDVRTFYFYTQGLGGVPDGPEPGNGGFGDWNSPSTRGWFARALWAAVSSHFGADTPGKGGYIP